LNDEIGFEITFMNEIDYYECILSFERFFRFPMRVVFY